MTIFAHSQPGFMQQPGAKEYVKYLNTHRQGVLNAYNLIILPKFGDKLPCDLLDRMPSIIKMHDFSKYEDEEFIPYCAKFYGHHKDYDHDAFNRAWMHHQNVNPHHWQYWILVNDCDEPQVQPMDMPLEYVLEMLCDWCSAGKYYGNTAYKWYTDQYTKFIMTKRTRDMVEKYIEAFK